MHPCTVAEETANTAHEIRAKRTTSVTQIYLLMLPCQNGHSFPGTRSTWVICAAAAAAEVILCIRRTWSIQPLAKGEHQTRKKETPSKPSSSAEHTAGSGYDRVIALLLSAHRSSRSALMHSLKTDTACVLQSAQLQTKAPNLLAVILFIIVGPQDKPKRSPIVLSIVQKCLISLFLGCSLQLLLNKIFSNVNKFKFQNSRNQFPGICVHKNVT